MTYRAPTVCIPNENCDHTSLARRKNPRKINDLRADLTGGGNVWHITDRFGAEFPGINGSGAPRTTNY